MDYGVNTDGQKFRYLPSFTPGFYCIYWNDSRPFSEKRVPGTISFRGSIGDRSQGFNVELIMPADENKAGFFRAKGADVKISNKVMQVLFWASTFSEMDDKIADFLEV